MLFRHGLSKSQWDVIVRRVLRKAPIDSLNSNRRAIYKAYDTATMVFGDVHVDENGVPDDRSAVYRGITVFIEALYTPKRWEEEAFRAMTHRLAADTETWMLGGRLYDRDAQYQVPKSDKWMQRDESESDPEGICRGGEDGIPHAFEGVFEEADVRSFGTPRSWEALSPEELPGRRSATRNNETVAVARSTLRQLEDATPRQLKLSVLGAEVNGRIRSRRQL